MELRTSPGSNSVSARINKECEISRLGQLLYSHYRAPVLAVKDFVKNVTLSFNKCSRYLEADAVWQFVKTIANI